MKCYVTWKRSNISYVFYSNITKKQSFVSSYEGWLQIHVCAYTRNVAEKGRSNKISEDIILLLL